MMAWKNKPPLSLLERVQRISTASVGNKEIEENPDVQDMETLEKRIQTILGITNSPSRKATDMLFFVMYDIESTKVRNQVAKYLIRQGCHRIQKSIFLANIAAERFNSIRSDLTQIQSFYDNEDSILLVPISTDYLQSMKIIGKTIDIDVITKSKNTLFF